MNIDNSIGMALISGDLSGTAAAGGQQGLVNSADAGPEGSLFQQLINQMLTGKSQNTNAVSGNLNSAEQNKNGETGDLLSELLLAGGNLASIGLQKSGKNIGGTAEVKGASDEKQSTDGNGQAMEMLQALMAGMTNTVSPVNAEKASMGILTDKSKEQQLAAISSVGTSGNPAAVAILKQASNGPTLQSGLNASMVPTDGKTGLATTAEGMTDEQSGISQVPGEQKQMSQTGSRLESAVLSSSSVAESRIASTSSAETTKIFSAEPIMAEAESGSQAVSGVRNQKESFVPAEKPKQETEPADGTDPARTGLQNPVQGTVPTGEIAESGPLTQTTDGPQPYSQIRDEILTRLDQNGPTEFKMQLQPEDLGQIDIKLKLSEGKLVIDILAADTRTQALLTSQVDKLISSMGLQNVQVESVQVGQHMNSQTQDNSQSQGFAMNSAMDFSQRRQHEQSQPGAADNGKPAGNFSLYQDEVQTDSPVNRTETNRYNFNRMNYSV